MDKFIKKGDAETFINIFIEHKAKMFNYLYEHEDIDIKNIEEVLRILIMESVEHYLGFVYQHLGTEGVAKIKEVMAQKIIEQIDTYKGGNDE